MTIVKLKIVCRRCFLDNVSNLNNKKGKAIFFKVDTGTGYHKHKYDIEKIAAKGCYLLSLLFVFGRVFTPCNCNYQIS